MMINESIFSFQQIIKLNHSTLIPILILKWYNRFFAPWLPGLFKFCK